MVQWHGDLGVYAQLVRQPTHIPSHVGVVPFKALAKLINRVAKKQSVLSGMLY
ncbi:hypothetical protein [Solirubrum puertoriconensis]|uniref:hypothetical protein n=1 Tax=Solirubrum puertoriconensis TaxID=1751427 RepID=UPI001365BC02|nr:hypothetical protein [Solirubrum puertoriconensis]